MSGITSGWGYSPQNVAGLTNSFDYNNRPLTYQESLTSTPIINGFISPLTINNKSYYTAFGKKHRNESILLRDITYLKSV